MVKTIYAAKGETLNMAPYMESFLDNFHETLEIENKPQDSTIKVSVALGSLAYTYEKIRNAVEYKGENVVRRNAIERIVKRLVWEKPLLRKTSELTSDRIATNLLRELVWARYLPNGQIGQDKTQEVKEILEKYLYIIDNLDKKTKNKDTEDWIWGIASSEIEDLLDPSNRDMFVDLMHNWFTQNFQWLDSGLSPEAEKLQIYLAVHRAFLKSDEAIMRYHLLEKLYPNWASNNKKSIEEVSKSFTEVHHLIEENLHYANRFPLYRKVKKYVAPFQIFQILAQKEKHSLRDVLQDQKKLDKKIEIACKSKYREIKERIRRSIFRSIIYIFITKIFIALIIEIPVEVFLFGSASALPLVINLFFPPSLMGLVGLTIKPAGDKNTQEIKKSLNSIVYSKSQKRTTFVLPTNTNNSSLTKIFAITYVVLLLAMFAFTAFILKQLDFSIVAILIFFSFLSLVLLFATKIKQNANEIKTQADEGILGQILELFSLPFLNLGFYLSKGFSKINIFLVIFDFLIEAPFKSIIEIIEEWSAFVRNKKDEVVNLPE